MSNAKTSPAPRFYFDARGGGYWLQVEDHRFLNLGSADARLHLRHAGFKDGRSDDGLNEVERAFLVCQRERAVDYAGPLGGHRVGLFETSAGARVLVTTEAKGVFAKPTAKPRIVPAIDRFFTELLGDQTEYFLAWLKLSLASLRAGDMAPGQMVVLAGPRLCGKSMLQSIVTEILGGRVAMPFAYMTGKTNFNSELAKAEHWMIEDQQSATDIASRRSFAARIKEATVNRDFYVHAKGREAICLAIFRRVTLSVNDEPENLMILPPLDDSLRDKMHLFSCGAAKLPESRKEAWESLTQGLPGLVSWLAQWRIPKRLLTDARFGVGAFQHPELVAALSSVAPESRLLELIDDVRWPERKEKDELPDKSDWTGTASEIERRLRTSAFAPAVHALLSYSSACGVYLARLAARDGARVFSTVSNGRTRWRISPPPV